MTISDKLTYLNETKNSIKEAIKEKGVALSDMDTFRSYADKISEIPSTGGTPQSPTARGLFLWFDGIKNAKDESHHKTTNGTWYPLVGGQFYRGNSTGYNYMETYFCEGYVPSSSTKNLVWDDKGCTFDGTNGYVPSYKNSSYMYGQGRMEPSPSEVTFEAVFKLSDSGTGVGMSIINNQESGGMYLGVNSGGHLNVEPYLKDSDGTYKYDGIVSSIVPQSNHIYYAITTFSNTTKLMTLRVICSDLNIDSKESVHREGCTLANFHHAPICIGGNPDKAGYSLDSLFKGTIYSARVYNKCLTDAEIENNIAFDKPRYNF